MLFDIWERAQAKWRGIVVYSLLEAVTRAVTDIIYYHAPTSGLKWFGLLAGLATSIFCLSQLWHLLTADREGDEAWPPIWS